MKKESLKMWLVLALVIVSLAAMFFLNRIDILPLVAFILGIVVVAGSLIRFGQCNSPEDERMRKIAAFSMMNSWMTGLTMMSVLLVLIYFIRGHALSGLQVICLAIMVMLATYYGWYIHYSSKGDVE